MTPINSNNLSFWTYSLSRRSWLPVLLFWKILWSIRPNNWFHGQLYNIHLDRYIISHVKFQFIQQFLYWHCNISRTNFSYLLVIQVLVSENQKLEFCHMKILNIIVIRTFAYWIEPLLHRRTISLRVHVISEACAVSSV